MVAMSLAPLVGEIRSDLNLSRGQIGLALGTWQFVYIATSPMAGRVIERLGVGFSLTLGALIVAISGIARSFANDLTTLCLAVALFGVGGPLVSACAPTAVGLWFTNDRERRFAVGAYTTAPAFGGIAVLVLSNSVLMPITNSWRWTMVLETAVIVLALFFWLLIIRFAPEAPKHHVPEKLEKYAHWKTIIKHKDVKIIFILGVAVFFLSHGLGSWMPEILREKVGFSSMAASNWTAGGTGIGILASLILPSRTLRRTLPVMLLFIFLILATSLAVMVFSSTAMTPIFVMSAGLRSALIPLVILALMESPALNTQNMGKAYGLWFASAEIGGVLGPVLSGQIADSTFGYDGVLWMMVLACFMMSLLTYSLRNVYKFE